MTEIMRGLLQHLWLLLTLRHDGRGLLTTYGGGMLTLLAITAALTAWAMSPLDAVMLTVALIIWRLIGVNPQLVCALLLFRAAIFIPLGLNLPFEQQSTNLTFYLLYEVVLALSLFARGVVLFPKKAESVQPDKKEEQ